MTLNWRKQQNAAKYIVLLMVKTNRMTSTSFLKVKSYKSFVPVSSLAKDNLAERSTLAKFRISFLEMTEVLLNFIYTTRSGNRDLYIGTARSTIPWFFLRMTGKTTEDT